MIVSRVAFYVVDFGCGYPICKPCAVQQLGNSFRGGARN